MRYYSSYQPQYHLWMSKHFGYVENGSFKMLSLKYVTYRALHVRGLHSHPVDDGNQQMDRRARS
jgi:hypothetical protein